MEGMMRMHRAPLVFLLFVLSTAIASGRQSQAPAVPGVTNYTRVDATAGCGGTTSTEAYPALKKEGYAAVINLRQADEPGANIEQAKAAAEAAGLRYIHVPVNGRAPQAESVDAFLAAVKDPANSPVYIHCATANRVGAVWLVKRVLVDGWDVEKATAEAERIGLRSPQLKQFALDYIAAHKG
jgi:uncharacterized protein (TIGR01244 family)